MPVPKLGQGADGRCVACHERRAGARRPGDLASGRRGWLIDLDGNEVRVGSPLRAPESAPQALMTWLLGFWPDSIAQQRQTTPNDKSCSGWSTIMSQATSTYDTLYGS